MSHVTSQETISPDQFKANTGFWLYLLTDCMLFASLFAAYIVLRPAIADGPSGRDIFEPSFVLLQTILLLTSSLTAGLAYLEAKVGNRSTMFGWLMFTFLLGSGFLLMEGYEFHELLSDGHSWQESAFLSAFFVLVATHGLHILIGLIWLGVCGVVIAKRGLTSSTLKKLGLFTLFWHFLDVIWIFIFTIVYMYGVIL